MLAVAERHPDGSQPRAARGRWCRALARSACASIGFLPAFIGLTLYSVLPVLRNTVTGLAGLDPALMEAARGVGMTSRQQLWRVELPLALPVILAGLRTSTVWTVGMATLSTPVGAPSLGNYIFARSADAESDGGAGRLRRPPRCWRSCSTGWCARSVPPCSREATSSLVAILAVFGLLYAHAGDRVRGAADANSRRRIVVGAKTFTEQYILSRDLSRRRSRARRASRSTWWRRSARPSRSTRFAPATSTPTSTTPERSGRRSCSASLVRRSRDGARERSALS